MVDIFSPEERSRIMSLVHSKNTEPEKIVFAYLRESKTYHKRHYDRALGKPDIALPRKKKAVFIDGDFWHGRNYHKTLAKHAPDSYWVTKITRNIKRDMEQRAELEKQGWRILSVWESDIIRRHTRKSTLESIKQFLISS